MDVTTYDGGDHKIDIPTLKPHFFMKLGMEFDSDEDAYMYYNEYAGAIGFSIRKEYVNKNKVHGYVTSRKLTCYKEGHRGEDKRDALVKNHRKETRTGCLAHIVVSRQPNGKFYVTAFEKNHNHPLAPPSVAHMLPSQRKILDVQALELDLADDSGIRPKYAFEYAARQAGGRANLGYTSRDFKNYIRDKRKFSLRHGEAGALLNYFETRRIEDPAFYFSVHLDDDDLITNIFWADAKMIMDYHTYGDVLSFDTTYRTNKNYRPFALFVGLNNHRNMVIFGACLLYDETIESFKWLFTKFLEVMSGRRPKTIITDQDPAMSKAIYLVMPDTYHRLCVWHLQQNALKHLSQVFRAHESFASDFSKLIYHYEVEEEFMSAWDDMLEKYDLRDNEWLKVTFSLRHKWSMTYGRNTFSAGMRSSQLSESFNGSLKGYLKSDLDLIQFFKHFQRAIDDKRYNEAKSLFDMTQRIPIMKIDFPLLEHAREVYTSTLFDMFQEQWTKSLLVTIKSCIKDGSICIYKVSTYNSNQEHTILANASEMMVSCSCKLFDYLGILCRHSLKVLDLMNIKMKIPCRYILKRWTKEATITNAVDIIEGNNVDDPVLEVTKRYKLLCPMFVQLSIIASESKEGYEIATKYASEMRKKLKELKEGSGNEGQAATLPNLENAKNSIQFEAFSGNGDLRNIKGLRRKEPTYRGKTRPKSFMEKATKKKRSSSKQNTGNGVQVTTNFSIPFNQCRKETKTSTNSAETCLNTTCTIGQFDLRHEEGYSQFSMEPFCGDSNIDIQGSNNAQYIEENFGSALHSSRFTEIPRN